MDDDISILTVAGSQMVEIPIKVHGPIKVPIFRGLKINHAGAVYLFNVLNKINQG